MRIVSRETSDTPPSNGTIERLKTRIADLEASRDGLTTARRIIKAGGSKDDLVAAGIHPNAAEALLQPDRLEAHTQSITISERTLNSLKRQLATAERKEKERMAKYGGKS